MINAETKKVEIQIPLRLLCSITEQLFLDPVTAADGHIYEREVIEQWLSTHDTSPKTGEALEHKKLTTSWDKREEVSDFLRKHPEAQEERYGFEPSALISSSEIKTDRIGVTGIPVNRDQGVMDRLVSGLQADALRSVDELVALEVRSGSTHAEEPKLKGRTKARKKKARAKAKKKAEAEAKLQAGVDTHAQLVEEALISDSETFIVQNWNRAFEHLQAFEEGQRALALLKVCAYVAADNIPREFLLACLKQSHPTLTKPESYLDIMVNLLYHHALLEKQDDTFCIHQALQIFLARQSPLSASYYGNLASICHIEFDRTIKDHRNSLVQKGFLAHLQTLSKHYDFEWDTILDVRVQHANLFFDMGHIFLYQLENFQEAKIAFEYSLSIQQEAYGLDHINLSSTLENLAFSYRGLGDYVQTRALLERALTIQERVHGSDHMEVAKVLEHLASTCHMLGDFAQEKTLLERVLPIFEKTYSSSHPNVCKVLISLSDAHKHFGNISESQSFLKRAYAVSLACYGTEHPQTRALEEIQQGFSSPSSITFSIPPHQQGLTLESAEIALKFRRDSENPKVAADRHYSELVKKAISLKVHLEKSSNGNTALHWALIRNQTEKIILLLRELEKTDQEAIKLLAVPNNEGKTPLDLFKEFKSLLPDEIMESVQKLLAPRPQSLSTLEDRLRLKQPLVPQIDSPEQLQIFLNHVVAGEQDQAEALLKKNQSLVLGSGEVRDLSGRLFENITGFQYAVWALDWHMWKMLLKYLPEEEARRQAEQFTTGPWVSAHGVDAGPHLQRLIDALKTYIDKYPGWNSQQCQTHWIYQVGRAQSLLPVHVLNEYCHPNRPFDPCPNFEDERELPRTRRVVHINEWYDDALTAVTWNGGSLGDGFGLCRGRHGGGYKCGMFDVVRYQPAVLADHRAVMALFNARIHQRSRLTSELMKITDPMQLQIFLNHVVAGEQDQAEALLKKNQSLILGSGEVRDLSGRLFENITGFQYAVWALDWHMWKMLLKYLPEEEARRQAEQFTTGPWVSAHGVDASPHLQRLIDALKTYIDKYPGWNSQQCQTHWIYQVGGAQSLLPVHVLNEYCHPNRSFDPCPNFEDERELPRTRMVYGYGDVLMETVYGESLGNSFGLVRLLAGARAVRDVGQVRRGRGRVHGDHRSLTALFNTRTHQRERLTSELMKLSVKMVTPQTVSSTVLLASTSAASSSPSSPVIPPSAMKESETGAVDPLKKILQEYCLEKPLASVLELLNHGLLNEQPAVIQFFVEKIQEEADLKEKLFGLISASKTKPSQAIAAANAATILNVAGIPFSSLDFSGIRIPGANLESALCDGTNFEGADLSQVNFNSAWLSRASFKNANLRDVDFGEWPAKNHESMVYSCAYSRDGRLLAIGEQSGLITIYNARTLEKLREHRGHSGAVSTLAYSPDGVQLCSGSFDKTLKVWDAQGWICEALRTYYRGHSHFVSTLAYSPDGVQLCSGSFDGTLKVWDAWGSTLEVLRTYRGHSHFVSTLAYSPDGLQLCSGSGDNTLKVWDARGGSLEALRTYEGHRGPVRTLAYSPDGSNICSGSDDWTLKVWDARGGNLEALRTYRGHSAQINTLAYSPDGSNICSGSNDWTLKVWDARGSTLEALRTYYSGYGGRVYTLAYSPDGLQLCLGSGGTLKVWDARGSALEALRLYSGHSSYVRTLAYSPDGLQLCSGSGDNTLKVWDARGSRLEALRTYSGHSSGVVTLVYSPDGSNICSGSFDNTLKVWDARGSRLEALRTYSGHSDGVVTLAYSPDGSNICSGSNDGTLKVWDARGSRLEALRTYEHSAPVLALTYSPDGLQLCSGVANVIRVWDARGGSLEALRTYYGHSSGGVDTLAYSPDGLELCSGSYGTTREVWDAQGNTLEVLRSFDADSFDVSKAWDNTIKPDHPALCSKAAGDSTAPYLTTVYHRDGKHLATGHGDGAVLQWRIGPHQELTLFWRSKAQALTAQNLNLEGVQNLLPRHIELLRQRGAVGKVSTSSPLLFSRATASRVVPAPITETEAEYCRCVVS